MFIVALIAVFITLTGGLSGFCKSVVIFMEFFCILYD